MYIVMNRLEVPADQAEAFEQRFSANMTGTLAGVAGLHRSALLRPNRDEDPYVAVMEFDSEESFRGWLASDAFRAAHGHGPRSGDGDGDGGGPGPSVSSYEVVTEVTNPA
ncbi:MAG: antibiotic biosynthesis monooxygenase family protein [Microthrixaceae bacterium]